MLGDFIIRNLILAFGYAYPAFECYKTLEKNKVNIEELIFWCQYWVIAAAITVFERFGDIFVSWIPLYGEAKFVLFVYLWYPKTKGCGFIYESIVRPYISKHQTDIDRSLRELRARAMDLLISYFQNFSKLGKDKLFETLQHFGSQYANLATPKPNTEVAGTFSHRGVSDAHPETKLSNTMTAHKVVAPASKTSSPPPTSSPPSTPASQVKKNIRMLSENSRQMSDNSRPLSAKKAGWPPIPSSPTGPSPTTTTTTTTTRHHVARSTSARTFPVQVEKARTSSTQDKEKILNDMVDQNGVDHDLQSPTLKLLRRSKTSFQQQ